VRIRQHRRPLHLRAGAESFTEHLLL
jgi:hypothetical protein